MRKALILTVSYLITVSVIHFFAWFISGFAMWDFSYFHFAEWGVMDRGGYLVMIMLLGLYGSLYSAIKFDLL